MNHLNIQDYDDMFFNDSYKKLGNFSYRKELKLPGYILTMTVCCYMKTRASRIKVSLDNEFVKINRIYIREFTPNIISNCRKIEKAYSNLLFIKDFNSILKRIDVKDD